MTGALMSMMPRQFLGMVLVTISSKVISSAQVGNRVAIESNWLSRQTNIPNPTYDMFSAAITTLAAKLEALLTNEELISARLFTISSLGACRHARLEFYTVGDQKQDDTRRSPVCEDIHHHTSLKFAINDSTVIRKRLVDAFTEAADVTWGYPSLAHGDNWSSINSCLITREGLGAATGQLRDLSKDVVQQEQEENVELQQAEDTLPARVYALFQKVQRLIIDEEIDEYDQVCMFALIEEDRSVYNEHTASYETLVLIDQHLRIGMRQHRINLKADEYDTLFGCATNRWNEEDEQVCFWGSLEEFLSDVMHLSRNVRLCQIVHAARV